MMLSYEQISLRVEWSANGVCIMEDSVLSLFFASVKPYLPEKSYRMVATSMAKSLGHGGVKKVEGASGMSRSTIFRGLSQQDDEVFNALPSARQRRPGGGRKSIDRSCPEVREALNKLINPYVKGDPMCALRWTTKSLRKLSEELATQQLIVSHVTVGEILEDMGYTLQSCKKSHEGVGSPDRNAQFEHINMICEAFFADSQPVISVDAKKKELIGNYKNAGSEYRPTKDPQKVNAYDFITDAEGRAVPYGVYDVAGNEGFVNVGVSSDTAEFAVNTILCWWNNMGKTSYPDAHSIFITADGGGSNGSRNRLWKMKLQDFANETGLIVYVSHFPPATSKWNKIEHRLFSAISMNWRGRPLDSFQTVVNLIANTTNASNLRVTCELDRSDYKTGIKVSDDDIAEMNILRHEFHPEWNYAIQPKRLE